MAYSDTFKFKAAMVGGSNVGKTAIITRKVHNRFDGHHMSTIGAAYNVLRSQTENGRGVEIGVFDTAGQERFHSLLPMYTRGVHAIILVYDVTDPFSLQAVEKTWMPYIQKNEHTFDPNCIKILIANKSDKFHDENTVDYGNDLAIRNGYRFYLTSAYQNINIDKVFDDLFETFIARITPQEPPVTESPLLLDIPVEKQKSTCNC